MDHLLRRLWRRDEKREEEKDFDEIEWEMSTERGDLI